MHLIDSGTGRIFEANMQLCTNDFCWGLGLDMIFASNTHTDYYPGSNVLGNLLEKIRDDYFNKDLKYEHNVNKCNVNDASGSMATSYDEGSPHNNKKKKTKLKLRGGVHIRKESLNVVTMLVVTTPPLIST